MTTPIDFNIPGRLRDAEPRHTAWKAILREPEMVILFDAWLRPEWLDTLRWLSGSQLEFAAQGFINGDRANDCRRLFDDIHPERHDEPADDDDDDGSCYLFLSLPGGGCTRLHLVFPKGDTHERRSKGLDQ